MFDGPIWLIYNTQMSKEFWIEDADAIDDRRKILAADRFMVCYQKCGLTQALCWCYATKPVTPCAEASAYPLVKNERTLQYELKTW